MHCPLEDGVPMATSGLSPRNTKPESESQGAWVSLASLPSYCYVTAETHSPSQSCKRDGPRKVVFHPGYSLESHKELFEVGNSPAPPRGILLRGPGWGLAIAVPFNWPCGSDTLLGPRTTRTVYSLRLLKHCPSCV